MLAVSPTHTSQSFSQLYCHLKSLYVLVLTTFTRPKRQTKPQDVSSTTCEPDKTVYDESSSDGQYAYSIQGQYDYMGGQDCLLGIGSQFDSTSAANGK